MGVQRAIRYLQPLRHFLRSAAFLHHVGHLASLARQRVQRRSHEFADFVRLDIVRLFVRKQLPDWAVDVNPVDCRVELTPLQTFSPIEDESFHDLVSPGCHLGSAVGVEPVKLAKYINRGVFRDFVPLPERNRVERRQHLTSGTLGKRVDVAEEIVVTAVVDEGSVEFVSHSPMGFRVRCFGNRCLGGFIDRA